MKPISKDPIHSSSPLTTEVICLTGMPSEERENFVDRMIKVDASVFNERAPEKND
ncbi:MAG: hypothetical protein IPO69_15055 [Saprospiraceae bacterium]|nr:hypothetical protein [Saprospiraceae bacterium]MBK7436169.1 hypothetical protein [Saprospiraceae bacterium]MBK9680162.1 hypothetical protein [Saprospiraceae bacterium]